jgi:hypothetical protein
MIMRSVSLDRRIARELVRHAGSLSQVVYYNGTLPASCDDSANGERVGDLSPVPEEMIRRLVDGAEPGLLAGATYWRLLDNGGLVVMQGDGT